MILNGQMALQAKPLTLLYTVDAVVQQYRGADFDGMQDLKLSRKSVLNGEEVYFGSDYIHTYRHYSSEMLTAVAQAFSFYIEREVNVSSIDDIDIRNEDHATVMRLLSDCDASEVASIKVGILEDRKAILQNGDVPCARCGFTRKASELQDKEVCVYCIEKEEKEEAAKASDPTPDERTIEAVADQLASMVHVSENGAVTISRHPGRRTVATLQMTMCPDGNVTPFRSKVEAEITHGPAGYFIGIAKTHYDLRNAEDDQQAVSEGLAFLADWMKK